MTQNQTLVGGALGSLKFDAQPTEIDGKPVYGGAMKFKVTDETISFLKGKTVVVGSDGKIAVE